MASALTPSHERSPTAGLPLTTQAGEPDDVQSEPRLTVSQVATLLGVLGLVFLVSFAAYMALHERRTLVEAGHDHAEQEAYFLAEHAQRLFEVSDIALRSTAAGVSGVDWDTIDHSPSILTNMHEIADMLSYVDTILLADATGHIHATTLTDTPGDYSVADRAVFKQAREAPADAMIVGEPIVGRVTHKPTFLIARRLDDAEGRFRGIVAVSMSLDYFTGFWERLEKRNDERILLVRAGDGVVLARHPAPATRDGNDRLSASVLAATAGGALGGDLDPGPHESGSFRRVGDLPVYVAVVYRDAVIVGQWRDRLLQIAPFFAAAFIALFLILAMGRRLARREALARGEMAEARAMLAASNSRLEQRVQERTADLQETGEEIQRFAYIVSHDLRAPLVNIMGFTSELSGLREQLFAAAAQPPDARETLRDDFDEALGFIHSSIDKMDRLIKAILSLSRQGQRKLKPEPLDMELLMRSIVDGVAHRVMQAGIAVSVAPLPPLIADRVAIEQIFANLIDNAVKYLRADVPGVITIGGWASATTVTYEVRDNGRGIDEKDRERVFELFRRAGRQDQPGEGIGLANVRSLVRRLQGTIALDSQIGNGCAFTVTLPKFGAEAEIQ